MSKNIQDGFLSRLQAEHAPVTVVIVNGYQIKGTICGFDQFTILMEANGVQNLVFKSAISTIVKGE